MDSFMMGLLTGCMVGVGGTLFLLILIAQTNRQRDMVNELSPRRVVFSTVALFSVAGVSYTLELDKTSATLLLLLSVLVIARVAGIKGGIAASVVAAVLLSFLFLPPIGSLWVISPGNRFALALFLLITVVGSRLVGEEKSSWLGTSDSRGPR